MIRVTLPDGNVREYEKGTTAMQVALSISEGLARNVLAAKVNFTQSEDSGFEIWDANRPLDEDVRLSLLTWNDAEGKATFWHSSAHLMAEALEVLYPGTKFGIGPAIEKGFYYDIDLGGAEFSSDHFKTIEDKMIELARNKEDFKRESISKDKAVQYFQEKGDEYKLDLLEKINKFNMTSLINMSGKPFWIYWVE